MNSSARSVLVTGTSRGIGAGIAESLLDGGNRVIGISRSEAARRLAAHPNYRHLRADLVSEDLGELVRRVDDEWGSMDALVNNAGIEFYADCWEQTDEEFDEMLELNVTVPFLLSQQVAAQWVERGQQGVIVNVCSVESAVAWPEPGQAAYAATKGGLLGLTRAMALDLARHGVRVLAIGPGAVETEMTPQDGSYRERIPLGKRPATPREIGDVVAFLASDGARYMTGEIVYVDGGYLLP